MARQLSRAAHEHRRVLHSLGSRGCRVATGRPDVARSRRASLQPLTLSLPPLLSGIRLRMQPPVPRIRATPRTHNPPATLQRAAALRTLRSPRPRLATTPRSGLRKHPLPIRPVIRPPFCPLPLRILRVLAPITEPITAPRRAELHQCTLPLLERNPALSANVIPARLVQNRLEIDATPGNHAFSPSGREMRVRG